MSHVRVHPQDFARIKGLPRRTYTEDEKRAVALRETLNLRAPNSTGLLFQAQALGLKEAREVRGLFAPIQVGGGKTLLTLAVSQILGAKRPVLFVPAALIDKTRAEQARLAEDWFLPKNLYIRSYQSMGLVKQAEELERLAPDLIILDECHMLKNVRAARTRRFARYFEAHPDTMCVAGSGTIVKKSLKDFAHIIWWCLKQGTPLPANQSELEEWALALDDTTNFFTRLDPGRLTELATPEQIQGHGARKAAVYGFQARLLETPGVVAHYSQESCSASLLIQGHVLEKVAQATEDNFERLRMFWEAPTGWTFSEAVIAWKMARELALGLHYEWDPLAPKPWLEARKAWAKFVRETINKSDRFDSELQVANGVDAGDLHTYTLADWRAIKNTFTPNPIPVWHDDTALKWCEKWGKENTGIVFTGHEFFAQGLAKRTGWKYYGAGGLNAAKEPIEKEDGSRTIIASIAANSTGRNLQMFSKGLVTTSLSTADQLEQLIGRYHRPGQKADTVEFHFLLACHENIDGFWRAHQGSNNVAMLTGVDFKLTSLADVVDIPRSKTGGHRWEKLVQ